jgi:hypothetical protein
MAWVACVVCVFGGLVYSQTNAVCRFREPLKEYKGPQPTLRSWDLDLVVVHEKDRTLPDKGMAVNDDAVTGEVLEHEFKYSNALISMLHT